MKCSIKMEGNDYMQLFPYLYRKSPSNIRLATFLQCMLSPLSTDHMPEHNMKHNKFKD